MTFKMRWNICQVNSTNTRSPRTVFIEGKSQRKEKGQVWFPQRQHIPPHPEETHGTLAGPDSKNKIPVLSHADFKLLYREAPDLIPA